MRCVLIKNLMKVVARSSSSERTTITSSYTKRFPVFVFLRYSSDARRPLFLERPAPDCFRVAYLYAFSRHFFFVDFFFGSFLLCPKEVVGWRILEVSIVLIATISMVSYHFC